MHRLAAAKRGMMAPRDGKAVPQRRKGRQAGGQLIVRCGVEKRRWRQLREFGSTVWNTQKIIDTSKAGQARPRPGGLLLYEVDQLSRPLPPFVQSKRRQQCPTWAGVPASIWLRSIDLLSTTRQRCGDSQPPARAATGPEGSDAAVPRAADGTRELHLDLCGGCLYTPGPRAGHRPPYL